MDVVSTEVEGTAVTPVVSVGAEAVQPLTLGDVDDETRYPVATIPCLQIIAGAEDNGNTADLICVEATHLWMFFNKSSIKKV